ncbi:hypothetical protein LNQ81_00235 [Myroides sp. M-43]|uniref:DUF6843 domain-containing protein n=1 Tax=Myroides oncorhynchi TaxID=2893756 RepID=UPI001E3C66D9|nr:hypothetical protein [Myroides oncorhynchi]MCC9041167.1 hypothetical protein [Myroides oncorhynchi]
MKKIFKVIGYIILGILVFLACVFIFWKWKNTSENEVFILPDDFEGAVIVLYNKQNGEPKKYDKEGNRIYTIPESGILKTKFKFQKGWRDIRYTRKNGTELRYLLPSDNIWNDTITKKRNDNIYVFNASYSDDFWFLVGKIRDINSLGKKMDEKWEQFSNPVILKDGDSIGNVRHNKIFDK